MFLQCPFCEKAFMNQSFLTAHIKNRHSKDTEAITAVSANTTAKAPLATSADNKENVGQLANGRRLEKEVKTLKEQLLQLERLLAEERQTRNAVSCLKFCSADSVSVQIHGGLRQSIFI